jgi:hypothetical protein
MADVATAAAADVAAGLFVVLMNVKAGAGAVAGTDPPAGASTAMGSAFTSVGATAAVSGADASSSAHALNDLTGGSDIDIR